MELYEALLKQAQRKEGGEDITDDPTKAAGQGTADPQDTATRGTTNTILYKYILFFTYTKLDRVGPVDNRPSTD